MGVAFAQCSKQDVEIGTDIVSGVSADRLTLLKEIRNQAAAFKSGDVVLRSGTSYTITEALDLLDESLNYAYCRPDTPLREAIILADTLVMAVTGSVSYTVSDLVVASLFSEASDNIGAQYHDLSLTNKEPWVFSVRPIGNVENNELTIVVKLEVAYGQYITNSIAFSSSDDYSYEYQGGMCDNTSGPGAPEVLRENLKFHHVYCPPNTKKFLYKPYYLWVLNVVNGDYELWDADGLPENLVQGDEHEWIYNPWEEWPSSNWDNINDWELFRQHSGVTVNYDECLSGDVEMPFNESKMGDIIQNYIPAYGYHPGNVWVGSRLHIQPNTNEVPFHNMIVSYCKSYTVETNDEPSELPDPE